MSAAELQKIYEKFDHINGELATVIANTRVLMERCDGIEKRFDMVWKLQLATLGILVSAVAGGAWFVLTVATRIILK